MLLILLLCGCFLSPTIRAQELDARVVVTAKKIKGVDQSVFNNLQKAIEQFLNSRQWSEKHYAINERIDCRFLLDLQQRVNEDIYTGTLTVQSIRPVYNASFSTTILNYRDKDLAFRYQAFQPLVFNETQVGS